MAVTVLTLQQCWIAPPGLAMTLAAAEIARVVGWVSDLSRRSSTSKGGSETHHRSGLQLIDIAALHPSYRSVTLDSYLGSLGTAVKNEDVNSQIQIVRLISSLMRISDSIRTSRHVRFALHV
jgi:hypothetical protein